MEPLYIKDLRLIVSVAICNVLLYVLRTEGLIHKGPPHSWGGARTCGNCSALVGGARTCGVVPSLVARAPHSWGGARLVAGGPHLWWYLRNQKLQCRAPTMSAVRRHDCGTSASSAEALCESALKHLLKNTKYSPLCHKHSESF